LKTKGYDAYAKGGGARVLDEYLKTHGQNQYYSNLKTVIRRLDDLSDGKWEDIHSAKDKTFSLTNDYSYVIDKYCDFCRLKGLTDGTI